LKAILGLALLVKTVLGKLQECEYARLVSQKFSSGFTESSIWVCTTKVYNYIQRRKNPPTGYSKKVKWPIRGKGSGGIDLREELRRL
jgi:hypothetical protein